MQELPTTKKSLGQHWLTDDASLEAMCEAVEVGFNDVVLEIGPGVGTLTEKLVFRAKQVIAVELDDILAVQLPSRVPAGNLQVVNEDILKYDLSALPPGYKVVANIPYYLTSNLLRVLLESPNPPAAMALLVQKEVAERVAAKAGDTSLLSVSVQLYGEVKTGDVIPAKLFTPPPKVDSQILIVTARKEPLFKDLDTKVFFQLVKAGFSARRKKLRSSLAGGLRLDKTAAEELLHKAKVDPNKRPQQLTLEQWHALYKAYTAK
jgi:16S rRNA (adenine1518-N6/adenine1519-N6)-dimethyltransferase